MEEETAQSPEQILPQPEPVVPPEIPPTPVKPKPWLKIFLFSVLGILVFAGAILGAYKFGQRKVQPSPTPTPVVVATPTPDLYTEASRSATANWKTYTNTKYGYSVKYPQGGSVHPITTPGATVETSVAGSLQIVPSTNEPSFLIERYNNPGALSTKDFVMAFFKENSEKAARGELPLMSVSKEKEITIGENISAYSYEVFAYDRSDLAIWVTKDKNAFLFQFITGEENSNYPHAKENFNTFNLMLSTFKFLPSAGSDKGE